MVSQAEKSIESKKPLKDWSNCRIGITGAKGSLGKALTKKLRSYGAFVIGLSHSKLTEEIKSTDCPNEWLHWECGKEEELHEIFKSLDILILNHGINPGGKINTKDLNQTLEVNAFSYWRLIEQFESISNQIKTTSVREIWINTSEAEIQPALSPGYEISKRLIGELISIKWSSLSKKKNKTLILRKLILGPFRSNLNPIGIMSPEVVATQIINQIKLNFKLIIVTPNPITYILVPLNELKRAIYFSFFNGSQKSN